MVLTFLHYSYSLLLKLICCSCLGSNLVHIQWLDPQLNCKSADEMCTTISELVLVLESQISLHLCPEMLAVQNFPGRSYCIQPNLNITDYHQQTGLKCYNNYRVLHTFADNYIALHCDMTIV